jgi:Ion transport protein
MIHEFGKFRTTWDIVVIILSIWICITQPFDIAFEPETFQTKIYSAFNFFIDGVFIFDIILNFRTTISDFITGEEVLNKKKIARKYIRGRFFIDLAAAVPFELISQYLI